LEESDIKDLVERQMDTVYAVLLSEVRKELVELREALREVQEVVSKMKEEAPMRTFHYYP
tara:strand:- start:2302 stop:2481 length:180 start_codon:yes stop_codon:yes gene_type:complete